MPRTRQTPAMPGCAGATTPRTGFTVTQRDIANRCGISQVAVSLALRNDPSISKEMIATVHNVAAELGYNPAHNDSARRLIARRYGTRVLNKVIALFMPGHYTSATYFVNFFQGVQETVADEGYALLVVAAGEHTTYSDRDPLPDIFARNGVDGVIDIGYGFPTYQLRADAPPSIADLPVVVFLRPETGCSLVQFDYENASYATACHLLSQGHRHLLQYLSFGPDLLEEPRIAGVSRALREFGLNPADHLHFLRLCANWLATDRTKQRTRLDMSPDELTHRQHLLDLLQQHPEITGILAWNDGVAQEIWYSLTQAGIRVPEDISLIGFDDTGSFLDDQGRNLLTTVRVPLYDMGGQAAQLVLRQINATHRLEDTVTLTGQLIVRASTAPPRQ